MVIKRVTVGDIEENAYILDYGDSVAVIDAGAEYEKIKSAIDEKPCTHVLLTHAHFDHIGAAAKFKLDGAKIYLHRDDIKLLNGAGNLSAMFGEKLDEFSPDVILSDGDNIRLGECDVKVLSTPGHTDGSVCYIVGKTILSGDTLFRMSVGRTDFPSGNAQKLYDSIVNKLFKLADEYEVLPGHGEKTTLGFEKKYNPYLCTN